MSLTFDGHDIGTLFTYGDPNIEILGAQPTLEDVPGRNGQAFTGMTYGSAIVSFTIAVAGDAATRRAALSTLGQWLMVDEPKHLVLPDTPDRYYLAVPDGGLSLNRGVKAEYGQLSFRLVDPIAYGQTQTASLPSGGSVSITIGGTAPTALAITANSAVRDSTSLVWGVRADNADFVHVATGSASSRKVVLDCGERTLTVAGSVKIPTLDSDWLVLSPGSHTLAMDNGTGAATVTWVERWY